MDRAADDTEELQDLGRACPRIVAAASIERERGYGGCVFFPFQPRVCLVEGQQEAAVQDGGDTVDPEESGWKIRSVTTVNASRGWAYGSTKYKTKED